MSGGERFVLLNSAWLAFPLDGSFKPSDLTPRAPDTSMDRAPGYTDYYAFAPDGYGTPQPIVLTATLTADSEYGLEAMLRTYRAWAGAATWLHRAGRASIALREGYVNAQPNPQGSKKANVTITLIPASALWLASDGTEVFF